MYFQSGCATRCGKSLFLGIFEPQQAILLPTQSDKFYRVFTFHTMQINMCGLLPRLVVTMETIRVLSRNEN